MSKIFHHTDPLPRYTDLGCYSLAYHVEFVSTYRRWAEALCCECATKAKHTGKDRCEFGNVTVIESFVHWEGEPIECEACGEEIESSYGPVKDSNHA